jgi:hypothetical protein
MERKFVRVLWIKAHFRYAYSAGDNGYIDASAASDLIKGGYIIPLPDTVEEKINLLPHDFPGRTVLFNSGFDTIGKIKQAGDSLLDAGISKATLTKVKTYLSTH